MNLLETTFDGESVRLGTHVVPLEPGERPASREGRVVLGIRPEAFEHGAVAPPYLPRFDAHADVVEELGADTHVCFRIEARPPAVEAAPDVDQASLLATESMLVTARVDPRTRVAQGQRLELAVDPARFHFFDAESGSALPRRGQVESAVPVATTSAGEWT